MTAAMPDSEPPRVLTGMPPPPPAMTISPLSASTLIASSSRISTGLGLATMQRQPRPESSPTTQPRSRESRLASSSL